MNRLKSHSSLFDSAPILVKEWHPTANNDLTPRNVKIGYSKKVWWLCNDGHKWQATIKSRLKHNDCAVCKDTEKRDAPPVNPGSPGKNSRKNRRFKIKVTAVIELPESGHWVYAQLTDLSSQGLCFETEAAIKPGTMIRIKFDKSLASSRFDTSIESLFSNGYQTYNSTVKWCKKLDDDQSVSNFGIGVQLC